REELAEYLHLEGVAVRPLHGRDPRVQPLRERDVGLSRRVVRPELLVHDLPAPFLDELPRRDHLPAGALRLVHRASLRPSSKTQRFARMTRSASEAPLISFAIPGGMSFTVNASLPGSFIQSPRWRDGYAGLSLARLGSDSLEI